MNQNHKNISICRIGKLGEEIEIQFSKKHTKADSLKIVHKSLELIEKVIGGIASEEANDMYQIGVREEVIPWSNEFPCSYKALI